MKTQQYIIIALIVFLMSALSQVVVKEYLSTEPRIVRDTITRIDTFPQIDTLWKIKYVPTKTIQIDTFIEKDFVIIPGVKDTLYITVPGVIVPGAENEINVYNDSLVNEDIALYYRHITHGRLIDFRFDKISYYSEVKERTIVRPPWLQIQGMAGAQISNTSIYPTVGIHANVKNIGAGFLSNGLGQTYFLSYNRSL